MSTNQHVENNAARAIGARRYIIFSVDKADRLAALRALRNEAIPYKVVQGYYQGTREPSYIVNADQWGKLYRVLAWAVDTQESILHLGPVDRAHDARPAILEYNDTRRPPVFLGYWWAVSRGVARFRDAWVRDGEQYYVAALERPPAAAAPHTTFPAITPLPGPLYPEVSPVYTSPDDVALDDGTAAQYRRDRAKDDIGVGHHNALDSHGAQERRIVGGHFNKAGGARTPSGHEF